MQYSKAVSLLQDALQPQIIVALVYENMGKAVERIKGKTEGQKKRGSNHNTGHTTGYEYTDPQVELRAGICTPLPCTP